MAIRSLLILLVSSYPLKASYLSRKPIVIATWPNMVPAVSKAWAVLENNGSALDSVELGINVCEEGICGKNVGFGARPDENGETTLDALIMDGETHNAGAVGALRRIKRAISVARVVMEHTKHTFLVGSQATEFAVEMGFTEENLSTNASITDFNEWKEGNCQPNSWINVNPDPTQFCGPYSLPNKSPKGDNRQTLTEIDESNHDTISMISIDAIGRIAVGVSTNGLRNKIPGRVGDSPIPGSGAYVDKMVGAAVSTGNGDVMMRFVPSYAAVEFLRSGSSPEAAAAASIQRIVDNIEFYPDFSGAIIAMTFHGEYGVACYGLSKPFEYTIRDTTTGSVSILTKNCIPKVD